MRRTTWRGKMKKIHQGLYDGEIIKKALINLRQSFFQNKTHVHQLTTPHRKYFHFFHHSVEYSWVKNPQTHLVFLDLFQFSLLSISLVIIQENKNLVIQFQVAWLIHVSRFNYLYISQQKLSFECQNAFSKLLTVSLECEIGAFQRIFLSR
jgi:hypothetical protein